MNLITIYTALSSTEAHLVSSRLEAAGFHPEILNDIAAATLGTYAYTPAGLPVQVPETEATEAKEFLDSSITLDPPRE